MTWSPSTTSRAGSVMLEPTSPDSLSTVTTSSSATFSCLPPQRTIAYTRELSLSLGYSLRFPACPGTPVSPRRARLNVHRDPRSGLLPTGKVTRPQPLQRTRHGFASPGRHQAAPPSDAGTDGIAAGLADGWVDD